ncbi:MAG TPA: ribonuclease P protein component [Planctomycetaceae bacterium]|nr:ribonuclease P protein component [Planctomycetaceae bacterium]
MASKLTVNVNRFGKRDRVKNGDDFTQIIRGGAFAADDILVVNVRRRLAGPDQASSRIGITIPRKTGPAVVRNRWKRWIREAFRTQRAQIPVGLEIIVRPKRDAAGGFDAIAQSLPVTVRRASRKLKDN